MKIGLSLKKGNMMAWWARARSGMVLLLSSASRGDVLMEYVLLTLLIAGPLVMASEGILFNIQGIAEGDVDNFGILGRQFVLRWRMIMCGVGLPLP